MPHNGVCDKQQKQGDGGRVIAKPRTTTLEDDLWDLAGQIGEGNHAKGLRKALRAYRAKQQEQSR